MHKNRFTAIILAAGAGKRMNSPLPKVIHPVAGLPMITRIIEACKKAKIYEIRVVIGDKENLIRQIIDPLGVKCFIQDKPLGTAHAIKSAQLSSIEDNDNILIINGDHPLITFEDIIRFIKEFEEEKSNFSIVTTTLKNPKSFGRIVRYKDEVKTIVEAKDASVETLKIKEINTGIYLINADLLKKNIELIQNKNLAQEFYFTDIINICTEQSIKVTSIKGDPYVAFGVNTQKELSLATKIAFKRKISSLLEQGVIIVDPLKTYIEEQVTIGSATVIFPNVYIRGNSKIGSLSVIEPNCYLINVVLGNSIQLKAGSYIENSLIKDNAVIGPYARIRPDTIIEEKAKIGNFVELKNVKFGVNAKANHLTYLGDAEIGENSNIGCGTITCNYAVDRKKYKTKIGKDTFIGSDSQFIAPVNIGDGAIIASGSTITKDVPENSLAISRNKQVNKENYSKKLNKKNK